MDDFKKSKNALEEKIRKNIASPFDEYLIGKIKPSIRLKKSRLNLATRISKIGGIPLVEDNLWPKSNKTNEYLSFLAQMDLGILSQYDLENQFPAKGVLSFYFNFDDYSEGSVIYYPETKKLKMANVPPIFIEEINRRKLPFWKRFFTKRKHVEILDECQLSGYTEYLIPSWDALQVELFHLQNGTKYSDIEITEQFIDEYLKELETNHHLLGYYNGLQLSTYEANGFELETRLNELSEKSIKKGLKWKLLFQMDSDELVNINWMDNGKLLFFIHEDDLKNHNFDTIKVVVDST